MLNFRGNKKTVSGIVLVCVSTFLTLFLFEIVLRLWPLREITMNDPYHYTMTTNEVKFGVPFYTYREIFPMQFDLRGYYKKSRGLIEYHFNQYGARWLKAEEQKIGDQNVIVIGDSLTYGFGVRYEDAFIFKVQNSLNKTGIHLSFVNFSTPGFDSRECLDAYNRVKDKIPHRYVIYGLHVNDLIKFPTSYVTSKVRRIRIKVREWSKAMDFMLGQVEKIKSRHENIKKLLEPSNVWQHYFEDNMNAIKALKMETEKRNAEFLVVILPILVNVREETFRPVYDGIEAQLANNKIDFIDLSGSVSSYKDSELWIMPFDQHPNEIANQIFAEKLTSFLVKEMKG